MVIVMVNSPEKEASNEREQEDYDSKLPLGLPGAQPRVNGVNVLLQLDPAAHVVDDDCREAAFLDQWHLGGDSLLRCDGVEAGAIAQSLPLDLRRAAKCTSAVSVQPLSNTQAVISYAVFNVNLLT